MVHILPAIPNHGPGDECRLVLALRATYLRVALYQTWKLSISTQNISVDTQSSVLLQLICSTQTAKQCLSTREHDNICRGLLRIVTTASRCYGFMSLEEDAHYVVLAPFATWNNASVTGVGGVHHCHRKPIDSGGTLPLLKPTLWRLIT